MESSVQPDCWPGESTAPRPTREAADEQTVFGAVGQDLSTPVAALTRTAEQLIEDLEVLQADQVHELASVIHAGALGLHVLVENLLAAATIRAGRLHLQTQPVHLLDVVNEIRPMVTPMLALRAQPLQLRSRRGLPYVSADSHRIGQVLTTLISNASSVTERGQPVTLWLSREGPAVRVTVTDRGPRIPGRFAPFHQGSESEASRDDGLLLRLAVVKAIIEAHCGAVGAQNRRGGGACFWFELTAQDDEHNAVRAYHLERMPV